MSESITRLSELQAGRNYMMEADGARCTIHVVYAGTSPICIVNGVLSDIEHDVTAPIVMQLVGWMAFAADRDNLVPIKDGFMHLNEKPSLASLVGAWHDPDKENRIQVIATEPTITEL